MTCAYICIKRDIPKQRVRGRLKHSIRTYYDETSRSVSSFISRVVLPARGVFWNTYNDIGNAYDPLLIPLTGIPHLNQVIRIVRERPLQCFAAVHCRVRQSAPRRRAYRKTRIVKNTDFDNFLRKQRANRFSRFIPSRVVLPFNNLFAKAVERTHTDRFRYHHAFNR